METQREESVYCLCKHFAAFHEQAKYEERADFAQPCSDCKIWNSCRGNWADKIGAVVPDDIIINTVM